MQQMSLIAEVEPVSDGPENGGREEESVQSVPERRPRRKGGAQEEIPEGQAEGKVCNFHPPRSTSAERIIAILVHLPHRSCASDDDADDWAESLGLLEPKVNSVGGTERVVTAKGDIVIADLERALENALPNT